VAGLAELGRLLDEELVVTAPVDLVTVQAVLRHGRVLEHVGSPLLRVALIAELVGRVRLDHGLAEPTMGSMAIAAFILPSLTGMRRLLRPDIFWQP
jgi:hypothetical protein